MVDQRCTSALLVPKVVLIHTKGRLCVVYIVLYSGRWTFVLSALSYAKFEAACSAYAA